MFLVACEGNLVLETLTGQAVLSPPLTSFVLEAAIKLSLVGILGEWIKYSANMVAQASNSQLSQIGLTSIEGTGADFKNISL